MWVIVNGCWDFEITIFFILEEVRDRVSFDFKVLNEGGKGGGFGCSFNSKLH